MRCIDNKVFTEAVVNINTDRRVLDGIVETLAITSTRQAGRPPVFDKMSKNNITTRWENRIHDLCYAFDTLCEMDECDVNDMRSYMLITKPLLDSYITDLIRVSKFDIALGIAEGGYKARVTCLLILTEMREAVRDLIEDLEDSDEW